MINLEKIYRYNSDSVIREFYQLVEMDSFEKAQDCIRKIQQVDELLRPYVLRSVGVEI